VEGYRKVYEGGGAYRGWMIWGFLRFVSWREGSPIGASYLVVWSSLAAGAACCILPTWSL